MEAVAGPPTQSSERLDQGSQSHDAPGCIEFPASSFSLRVLHRLWIHRLPWLYGCVLEVRSLVWRIVRLRRTQLYRKSLDMGPAFERTPHGSFQECIRTRACSADMRNLYATRPGLTILDAELFLAAWKLGWESGHSHADIGKPDRLSASLAPRIIRRCQFCGHPQY
jgi:hypothetical protein